MASLINIPQIPTSIISNVDSTITEDRSGINKRVFGFEAAAVPGVLNTTITYTVPVGKAFIWHSGFGHSDGDASWQIEIDGLLFNEKQNHQTNPDVDYHIGAPFKMLAGTTLTVKTMNRSVYGTLNSIEAFIYGYEYTP